MNLGDIGLNSRVRQVTSQILQHGARDLIAVLASRATQHGHTTVPAPRPARPQCGAPPPEGRGRGAGRGRIGTWVRAVPGTYTIRLAAGGQSVQAPVTVRLDPRLTVAGADLREWHGAAQTIERTECRLGRAVADLTAFERRLTDSESRAGDAAAKAELAAIRAALRPIVLALRGDPRDPGHVNLPGRINWLTIQVGNNSGRPTAAQSEWIARYAADTDGVVAALEKVASRLR